MVRDMGESNQANHKTVVMITAPSTANFLISVNLIFSVILLNFIGSLSISTQLEGSLLHENQPEN